MCMPNVLACLSKLERTYWSLTPLLDQLSLKPLLTWVMINTSMTTQTSSRLAALKPCIKAKVCTLSSISYNFLVADYRYSTASLSYICTSHLDTSVKCTLSYWLAALQHIPCLHSAFDGKGTSLHHQPTSLNRLCAVFLAFTQLRYRCTMVAWPFSAQQVSCLFCHRASTWVQLPPTSTHCRSMFMQ